MVSLLNMGCAEAQLLWLIVLEKTKVIIGDIGVIKSSVDKEASLSYRIMKAHRHHGYASEAIRALTFYRFWFDAEGLERIIADILTENASSRQCVLSANYGKNSAFDKMSFEQFTFDKADFNALVRELSTEHYMITSGCLMGLPMRYDGGVVPLSISNQGNFHLIPLCPEQLGGLSTPRDPVEFIQESNQYMTQNRINCTQAFLNGADVFVSFAKRHKTCLFLLKQNSPSCGSLAIYDGSFMGVKIKGEGCTVKMIQERFNRYVIIDEVNNMCINL